MEKTTFYSCKNQYETTACEVTVIPTTVLLNNGNCTEWSAIWSEIKRVITKSHDREAEDTPPAFLPVLLRRGSIATSEQNRRTYLYRYLTNGEDNELVCA